MDLLSYLEGKARLVREGSGLWKVEPSPCCNHKGCGKYKQPNNDKAYYKCYSCGTHAKDPVSLESKITGTTYHEARIKLYGGDNIVTLSSPHTDMAHKNHNTLMSNPLYLKWLIEDRKISPDIIKRFMIGCYCNKEGYIIYTFPYFKGTQVLNVKSRSKDKSVMFQKKDAGFYLYNYNALANIEEVLVVEGEMDVLAACTYKLDLPSVSFALGGNNLKPEWKDYFNTVKTVFLAYDNDQVGSTGANKMALLLGYERCKFVTLPHKDMNDCLIAGATLDDIKDCINKSLYLPQLNILKSIEAVPSDEKVIGEKVTDIINKIARRPDLETEDYIRAMRERLPISFKQSRDMRKRIDELRRQFNSSSPSDSTDSQPTITDKERSAALALLKRNDCIDVLADSFKTLGLVGETDNAIITFLCCLTRLMEQQSHVLISGMPASGKSLIADQVINVIPDEQVITISSSSAQAFNYLAEEDLQQKLIVISELDGAEDVLYTIRIMQSEGKLNRIYVGKDETTGEFTTFDSEKTIKASFLITTNLTPADIDPQNTSRLMILFSDESVRQSEQVKNALLYQQTRAWKQTKPKREEIKVLVKNTQRLLRPLEVDIPYAEHLLFPARCSKHRRDLARFLSLIKAVAFFRQYQKPVKKDSEVEYIECDLVDYTTTYKYLKSILSSSLNDLSLRAKKVLDVCCLVQREKESKGDRKDFCYKEIQQKARKVGIDAANRENLRILVQELVDEDMLTVTEGRLGQRGKRLYFTITFDFKIDPTSNAINGIELLDTQILTPEELKGKLLNSEA